MRLQTWKILGIVVMVSLFMASAGSSCSDSNVIDREEAIRIAIDKVHTDVGTAFDDSEPVAIEEEDCWHVCFPLPSPEMLGGEANIFVDKFSGAIIRAEYTQ